MIRYILFGIIVGCFIKSSCTKSLYDYEVTIDHFEKPKESNGLLDFGDLRVKKFNRSTSIVDGNFEFLTDLTDDYTGGLYLYSLQANEYRNIFQKNESNICSFWVNEKQLVPKILENIEPKMEETCPIKARKYRVNKLLLPTDKLPIEPTLFRKGKLTVIYYLNGEEITQFSVFFMLNKVLNTMI